MRGLPSLLYDGEQPEKEMQQRKYSVKDCVARQRRWQAVAMLALENDLGDEIVTTAVSKAKKDHDNVCDIMRRSAEVSSIVFNINACSDAQLFLDFRFKAAEIGKLTDVISWSGITERNRYACDPITATCILLFRLSTPGRLRESELKFGMFSSKLSEVFWEVLESFMESVGDVLQLRQHLLSSRAALYAEAIRNAGSPLESCVGFIDCTKIQMQRPGGSSLTQRACYSGHKRMHCFGYQSLTTPDGLIFALFGPDDGRRHDMNTYRRSGWGEKLQDSLSIEGRQFYIFGDKAYHLRPWLLRPFTAANLSPQQLDFNGIMSSLRESVEHNYKDLKQNFVSQDFPRNLKARQAPISLMYKASAILWNLRVCAYKSGQVADRFGIDPPTFDLYLSAQ